MNTSVNQFYSEKAAEFSTELKLVSQKLKWFVWYRLTAFILIFFPLFIFGTKSFVTLFFSLTALVVFLFLVKKNIQLEKKKKRFLVLKKLADDELLALGHTFSHFKNGAEFLDTEHFFSYDLDLFGEGSLYQFINRGSTIGGRKMLAEWFIHPELSKKIIEEKQEAIKELAKLPEWRLEFLAGGLLFEETEEMNREFKSWAGMELNFKNSQAAKWLIKIVPAVTFLALIPAILGISNFFISAMVLLQWVLMFSYGKTINKYFRFFGRKSELLEKYIQLLKLVEDKEFKSDYLSRLQQKIKIPDSASHIFNQLKKHVKEFEFRGNIIVGFFLNSIFTWDIRCIYLLWKWHTKNHHQLAVWLDVISEIDALISLANYANNHADFVYPEIDDNDFVFNARQLGHPLLNPKKRVRNDFEIKGWSKVMVVTGANMAGKSTFLRTVGVNFILARLGVPVCADEMKLTPVKIYTNMRTTDSLLKDESYFFAELKRIKGVLNRLQNGEQIFVILDEMLKGTNSVDKLNGSKELVRKLLQFQSVSLIATHDLKLSEMEKEYPGDIFNKCFEIRIENDEMVFDYKLSNGVTQTMNATFLMKKMGII